MSGPIKYACTKCGAAGCKLWRECQVMYTDLLCAGCAPRREGETGEVDADGHIDTKYGKTDQIGSWLVPAVPLESGRGYHGYGGVPADRVAWWRALPTYPSGAKP